MTIPPIPPIGQPSGVGPGAGGQAPAQRAEPGFEQALKQGLGEVSALEHAADAVAMDMASGGDSEIADLMVATTKSQISMDLLLAVRNRAVEAYQEIMRLPV